MIQATCPTCAKTRSVPDKMAGQVWACSCGERVRLPASIQVTTKPSSLRKPQNLKQPKEKKTANRLLLIFGLISAFTCGILITIWFVKDRTDKKINVELTKANDNGVKSIADKNNSTKEKERQKKQDQEFERRERLKEGENQQNEQARLEEIKQAEAKRWKKIRLARKNPVLAEMEKVNDYPDIYYDKCVTFEGAKLSGNLKRNREEKIWYLEVRSPREKTFLTFDFSNDLLFTASDNIGGQIQSSLQENKYYFNTTITAQIFRRKNTLSKKECPGALVYRVQVYNRGGNLSTTFEDQAFLNEE